MGGYGLFLLGFQGATCFKFYKSTGATGFWKEDKNNNHTNPNNHFWHQPPVVPGAKMSSCVDWGNEAVDKSGNFRIAHLFLTGHIFYSCLLKIGSSGRPDRTEIELTNPACYLWTSATRPRRQTLLLILATVLAGCPAPHCLTTRSPLSKNKLYCSDWEAMLLEVGRYVLTVLPVSCGAKLTLLAAPESSLQGGTSRI